MESTAETPCPQQYWDQIYAAGGLVYDPAKVQFKDLFAAHLPAGGSCFEVGCYPGTYLAYLGKTFGYTVGGIDATPNVVDQLPRHLRSLGVRCGEFHRADFFTFRPAAVHDVVCSFGFLEHFPDLRTTLAKHAEHVKPGGTLFLSCPHFRRAQWLFHRLFDAPNLRLHVLETMDLDLWARELRDLGLSVVDAGFHGTFNYWAESPDVGGAARLANRVLGRVGRDLSSRKHQWPNRLTSPYMYCVARKPAA